MAVQWTRERIASLSDEQVILLRESAERKLNDVKIGAHGKEVLGWCNDEIEARGLNRKATRTRASSRASDPLKIREDELATDIAKFAARLKGKFDLSAETARWLSASVPNFKTHNLTQANGSAKVGGLQRSGRCKIDRYISYRVRDRLVSLNIWLGSDGSVDQIEFQVFAPQDALPEGEPLAALRPAAKNDAEMKLFGWGRRFTDLEAAKARFEEVLAAVAPRL